jgi:CGNR zinc finger/Putative stress-induced transcription regulator
MPAQLAVVASFLNTAQIDGQPDQLMTAPDLTRWLVRHRLVPPGTQFDDPDRERLLEFRDALAQLAAGNSGNGIDRRAVTTLNDAARRIRLGIRLHPADGYRLIAEGPGVDRPIGDLLLRVMSAMNTNTWQRLKVCGNPDCGRVFYDSSRNRSARWCSMATCGNRMKGRAYRRRKANDEAAGQNDDFAVAS